MARVVSHVFTIFPFERALYEGARVPAECLGHPLRDFLPDLSRDQVRQTLGISPDALLLGLLPGSRRGELARHLPLLLEAADRIRRDRPAEYVLPLAPTLSRQEIEPAIAAASVPVRVVEGKTYEAMAASDLLLVASGTATLEAAWFGTPMVIFYRLSWVTTALARRLLTVRHVGLPNLLAGEEIVPELLDKAATGKHLAEVALGLLRDPGALQAQRERLVGLRPLMGEPGVADRAAARILELVCGRG
jgi:lipid-A-disaccharide synthase